MHANKFSIGGLIGVHVSSIVNWGYLGNFQSVYFFFPYRKILQVQKAQKCKSSEFHPLISLCVQKTTAFVIFLRAYFLFYWLIFVCQCFCTRGIFLSEKINRLEIVPIASIHYATKANNKDTRTTQLTSLWCVHHQLQPNPTPYPNAPISDPEKSNVHWAIKISRENTPKAKPTEVC